MFFVIEHLEPHLSEWLLLEYSHAAKAAGENLVITNVKNKNEFRKLSKIARVERKRTGELFDPKELIVLDPRARKKLSPEDARGKKAIVVGGILGGDPPLGRTKKLLTSSLSKASVRSIGENQFTIDGAVYVAQQVSDGKRLNEIAVQNQVEIQIEKGHSVVLPYTYPVAGGRPVISKKLIAYLKRPWLLTG